MRMDTSEVEFIRDREPHGFKVYVVRVIDADLAWDIHTTECTVIHCPQGLIIRSIPDSRSPTPDILKDH